MEAATAMAEVVEQRLYRPDEAARYLRLSRRSLFYLVAAGKLRPHRPTPRRPLFTREQLDQYLASS